MLRCVEGGADKRTSSNVKVCVCVCVCVCACRVCVRASPNACAVNVQEED